MKELTIKSQSKITFTIEDILRNTPKMKRYMKRWRSEELGRIINEALKAKKK